MSPNPLPSPLQQRWLCETIRLREEQAGLLEDGEANRRARAEGGGLEQRIIRRALFLSHRDGQLHALRHWLQGARLALFVLMVLAGFSGIGLAVAALGDGQRPVNVLWALGSLLGLNLLMLLGWLLNFLAFGSAVPLGQLWLWLSEKLARDAQAAQLAPALLLFLQRQRLSRWALGLLTHGLWSMAMLCALATLLLMLATRRYGFVWETTILGSETFISLIHVIGLLPAQLGFGLPDAELIRASGDNALTSEQARHSWASWLTGVLLVYGLLPRLLLLMVCLWRWWRGLGQLRLDLQLPGYSLLRERLQPDSERLGISDAAPDTLHQPPAGYHAKGGKGLLLVAIELDDGTAWPPPLPESVLNAGVIDSREQRHQLLDQLSRFPAQRLVIACDPRRSPDRGTLALLGELAGSAVETRIWLLPPPIGEQLDESRLGAWHEALNRTNLTWTGRDALSWLESGHD